MATTLLVEAKHPVAAVSDDQNRHRQVLLGEGGQLAGSHREAAVPQDSESWRPGRGDPEGGGQPVTERSPTDRVEQLTRAVHRGVPADPVAGDGHVADHRVARGPGALDGIDDGDGFRGAGVGCGSRADGVADQERGVGPWFAATEPQRHGVDEGCDVSSDGDVWIEGAAGVEVDVDHAGRARQRPVGGGHAVERRAEDQQQVGVGHESAGARLHRRRVDEQGVAGRQDAARGVGGKDRRAKPPGQRVDVGP